MWIDSHAKQQYRRSDKNATNRIPGVSHVGSEPASDRSTAFGKSAHRSHISTESGGGREEPCGKLDKVMSESQCPSVRIRRLYPIAVHRQSVYGSLLLHNEVR